MNRILRILILVAAVPTALSGCFLSGGDNEEKKGTETAAMDASGAPHHDAVQNTPPSPWRTIELKDEGGSSGNSPILPIVAIVLSVISLGLNIIPWIRHRRHRVVPPV
jgi:hypothetical protein